jgi:hypothetical protein
MKKLLFVSLFLISLGLSAQDERVEISGRVYVKSNDLEGIAVYNSSANEGTATDEQGRFVIEVKLNDVINFSALQFKDFSVTINQDILDSGSMTAMLVEDVNKLDEVILLPYDLSGSLFVDLNAVRTYNVDMDSIYSGVTDQDKYKLSADNQTRVNNAAVEDQMPGMQNGLNIVNLVGLMLKPFQKKKLEKESRLIPNGTLITRYDAEFLETHFKIPRARSGEFIVFVEEKGVQASLWREDRELELLELLYQESLIFLNPSTDND